MMIKAAFASPSGPSHAQELWHKRPTKVSLCSLISCCSCFIPATPSGLSFSAHTELSFLCDFAQSYLSAWTGFPQFVTWLTSPHPLSFNSDATSSRKPSLTSFSPYWVRHPSSALLGQLSSNLFILLPRMFSPLSFQNLVLDESQCMVPGTK